MAVTVYGPERVQAIGSMTRLMMGVAGGSGTSIVVTLPANVRVKEVLVGGNTSVTAAYCATISTNTFTVTVANNDIFTWLALVDGGI